MQKIISWLKNNKLSTLLIIALAYLIFTKNIVPLGLRNYATYEGVSNIASQKGVPAIGFAPERQVAPQPDVSQRKVVTESNLSLLVKDVRESLDKIQKEVDQKKGYVVNTYVSSPEGITNGYITIRVPVGELKTVLETLRKLSIRVVSENISGYDVTDQYVDIQARLETLNKTKAIYDGILNKATNIDEILRVQQAIFTIQNQIDSYKGQLIYLDATSSSTLITVNLSTDELSLPYAPQQPWRPSAVFKEAVRSLIGFLRLIGTAIIWAGVYSVVILPIVVGIFVIRRRRKIH